MNRLRDEYRADFLEVRKYIEKFSAKGSEQEEALEGLLEIYVEAQENKTPVSEIHECSPKDYAREIAEVLPQKNIKWLKKALYIGFAAAAALMISSFVVLNMSEDYHMKIHGLGHVFISPFEFSVTVEKIPNAAVTYFDGDNELQYDSLFSSEIYSTGKGITSSGFIKNSGIVPEKISFSDDENFIFIEMRAERTFDEFGREQIVSPAVPENKTHQILLEKGNMTHFASSKIRITAGESNYEGAIRDIFIDKKGNIRFTAKAELSSGAGIDIEDYLSEGNPLKLDFGSACVIRWERKADSPAFSPDNFSFADEFHPELRTMVLEKTTSDGRLTVSFGVFINPENEIVDTHNGLTSGWGDEITENYTTMEGMEISDDRKSVFLPVSYKLESGETVNENLILTLADAKYSFDRP